MKPGETIAGRFTVDAFVARGGMGDVYRATDTVSGRQVAVKVIAADHPGMGRRLAAEARALRQLRHPGIVAYVAHEADPERPMYLAMEWLEGITLSERLRTSDLSVTEALTLAARVADALGVAHARGIIHRDIKPLNLFVVDNRPDQVKILDFGIARLSSDERITATGVGMGTPEYMAPEQARCDAVIGPPADIFGLGCVLYKCLTGKTAFRGPRVEAILAKIAMLDEVPRVLAEKPDIPPLVDELTAQLMAFAPGDRPQDGAAAAAAIRACSAALRRGVTFDPDREFAASPSLTRREVQPVSIIFAEPNVAEADTLPAELWQALAPPIGAPTPVHATGPTADTSAATERTFERLRVLRGSSDIDHLMPAIRAALEPHAARVEALLNGSIVTLVTGGVAATDLAARSARAALAIRSILGDASLGIATVRAVTTDRAALDPIIDAAASLVRPRSRQIRIDKHTRNLLSERFAVTADDAGGFVLELERTLTAGAGEPPRRVLGRATPCVGRNRLLRQLGSVVAGCIDDRAAEAVVIVGDAGFGKSRLRAELSRQLRADHDPLWILAAWGDLLRDRVPYGLVGRMLRDALAVPDSPREPGQLDAEQAAALTRAVEALARDDAEARRLAAFLGELCGVFLDDSDDPALRAARQDPQLMGDQLRRAFEDFVVRAAQAGPVVILIDDLHWADQPSVELLGKALTAARDQPLALIALGRPGVHDRFPALAETWSRQEIPLEPLRPSDCAELVREVFAAAGPDALDPAVVSRIVDRSAGNPFYLEELIRAAAAGDTALPESVLASVQLRIGRLADDARQVLRAASVYGRVFWARGVCALLGPDSLDAEVQSWLAALERDELVDRLADSRLPGQAAYAFRHDLVREASYEMLTDADRQTGHRLAGDWLAAAGENDAVVLAEHFAGGGAAEKAVEWFEKAAQRALVDDAADAVKALQKAATNFRRAAETAARAYANEAASRFFERSVALWAALDAVEAATTRLAMAEVLERVGRRDNAIEQLAWAEAAIEREKLQVVHVRLPLERAKLEMRSDEEHALSKALDLAHKAHHTASQIADRHHEAEALAVIAGILTNFDTQESHAKARQYADLSLALQREHGQQRTSLWRLGNAFLLQNDLARARQFYRDALGAAERGKDELLVAYCLSNLGFVAFREWRVDEAIEMSRQALETYERIGHQTRITEMSLNLGAFFQVKGDAGSARPLLEQALQRSRGDWLLTTPCHESLAEVARFEGDELRAQAHLVAAAELCRRVAVPQKEALFLGQLAESFLATGDCARALRTLERAVEVGEGVTLSHALIMVKLGRYREAELWLRHFEQREADPHRKLAAQLARTRLTWWQTGASLAALELCASCEAVVARAKLPAHALPVYALRACMTDATDDALARLREARHACSPSSHLEIAIDLASTLAAASRAEAIERALPDLLDLARVDGDRSLLYRLQTLVSKLLLQSGASARAASLQAEALATVSQLEHDLPDDYANVFRDHPWVVELRQLDGKR